MRFISDETIVAISTPIGSGGIGIVRMSGSNSLEILEKIYRSNAKGKINKKVKQFKTHSINYGFIFDGDKHVDEVLVCVMLAPKTYTKEDVVEINCHGGIKAVNKVLETVIKNGGRLADKGEFTKRGFLNGRIDLSQAEGIMDVINAKTDLGHDRAIKMLEGDLSKEIKKYREEILLMIANIEVSIDYPEHELEHKNNLEGKKQTKSLIEKINTLLRNFDKGKIIREGIKTIILGKPNVGKSSLLNNLLGESKAIVTHIKGTTRDALIEYVNIKNIPLQIIDTAGIRDTEDEIEKIGVNISKRYATEGQLFFVVLDGSEELEKEDREVLKLVKGKEVIILINKIDLDRKIKIEKLKEYVIEENIIEISAKENIGLEKLFDRLEKIFFNGNIEDGDEIYISNRHKECLLNAKDSLNKVLEAIQLKMPEDLLVIDLKDSYDSLLEITGEQLGDNIIDKIFSEFCLGK